MAKVAGFSEATYIGLHAMVLISQKDGERISIREMAETICVSEAHLAKVVLRLAHTGLISTTRGPCGPCQKAKRDKLFGHRRSNRRSIGKFEMRFWKKQVLS